MNPPSATTVATVEPEIAPKRPQPRQPAIPNPPGSQLTSVFTTLISFSTMLPAVMMLPQRMKKSTTTRAKLSMLLKKLCVSMSGWGSGAKRINPRRPVKNRPMYTGT